MVRHYTRDRTLRCGDIFVIKQRAISCGVPSVQRRIGFKPSEAVAVHVGIILNSDGDIAESLGSKGVVFDTMAKYKHDYYVVLRPKVVNADDIRICLSAARYMLKAGRIHYDWLAILGLWFFSFTGWKWLLAHLNKRYRLICTEFVLKIYELAHEPIDDSDLKYYPANFISLFNRGLLYMVYSHKPE